MPRKKEKDTRVRKTVRKKRKLHRRKRRLSAKKRGKIEKIVDVHYERVFNLVLHIVENRHNAEDITQEAFERLCDQKLKYVGGLYITAIHLSLNCVKQSRRFVNILLPKLVALKSVTLLPRKQHNKDTSDVLFKAVQSLSIKQQQVVVLHYFEGFSVKEIAPILGISKPAIKTRLCRARCKLKTFLLSAGC